MTNDKDSVDIGKHIQLLYIYIVLHDHKATMQETTLPTKYYLHHLGEIFQHVQAICPHLLAQRHWYFLQRFAGLDEDEQAMMARILSRKPKYLQQCSLQYEEIRQPRFCLKMLCSLQLLATPDSSEYEELLPSLTKKQLLDCLDTSGIPFRRTASKAHLLHLLSEQSLENNQTLNALAKGFVRLHSEDIVHYLFYLFFGNLNARLQKFAMRDLGLNKSPAKHKKMHARFTQMDSSRSAFMWQKLEKEFDSIISSQSSSTLITLMHHKCIGEKAEKIKARLLLKLGLGLQQAHPHHAIMVLRASHHEDALAKWVRLAYRHQDKLQLLKRLKSLRQSKLEAADVIFIDDFIARHYQSKRTSIYTDLLRQASRTVVLDEAFAGQVEQGVMADYKRHNIATFFSENRLWKMLFACTLWDILFSPNATSFNEFDHFPARLKQARFYQNHEERIAARLGIFSSVKTAQTYLSRIVSQHYGAHTGLFRWRTDSLEMMLACVANAPEGAIQHCLNMMARNFSLYKKGFPDLMIVAENGLRFREVKGPSDVLRPHQLVSHKLLREAGFEVGIITTQWSVNPLQIYSVVDIETTGSSANGNSITEIGVVQVRNQEVIYEWSSLLNPKRTIPPFISKLTGIDDAMVAGAPSFAELAGQLSKLLSGTIFVAHNVAFDYGFIDAAFKHIERPWALPKLCTIRKIRRLHPRLKSYSLKNLCEYFDIPLQSHHRALADARAAAELLILAQKQESFEAN